MKLETKRPSRDEPAAETQSVGETEYAQLPDAAYVFGSVVGSSQPIAFLMDAVRSRLEALRDPMSAEAVAELQRQLPILEALFLRFSTEAANSSKGAVHRTLLLRAALQAQQAYSRSFALLHTVALQARAQEKTVVALHCVPETDSA